jgi:hypothetical protein
MSLAALCKELALKHRLSPEETLSIMAAALSDSLTRAFRRRVITCLDGERLRIYKEENNWGGVREIDYRDLSRDDIRLFRSRFEKDLMKKKAFDEHEYLSTLQGTIVRGVIDRVLDDGSLFVLFFIEELFSSRELYALCPINLQSPRERRALKRGEARFFFVSSVRLVRIERVFRHDIRLSRTNPRLVEALLMKLSGHGGIRCVRRIAGKMSLIVSTAKIPRETVKAVSRELGERIVVRWHSSKRAKPQSKKRRRTPTWG